MYEDKPNAQSKAEPSPSRIPSEVLGKTISAGSPPEVAADSDAVDSATFSGGDQESLTRFAEETHQYIREYIRLADQKAAFFLGFSAALLSFLYSVNVSQRWLKSPTLWSWVDLVAFLAMVGLALAAILSFAVVIPRLKKSNRGIIFWDSIAQFSSSLQYLERVHRATPEELVRTKLEHCFDLARVCQRKYRLLGLSVWLGAVGAGSSMMYLLFS